MIVAKQKTSITLHDLEKCSEHILIAPLLSQLILQTLNYEDVSDVYIQGNY
ncbi:hypothetical protein NC99_26080 [Sunxiuqinia dokdonensis]|uniref:Uncharacterized protein n=1 Tax=Sunxiuqinia dokdonensis TaxID=1409788 RepID=A0A0L8V8D7_9BACT|nr:hypothetical protein NC99_26080 [Sunxiuqinia dokdonensis]